MRDMGSEDLKTHHTNGCHNKPQSLANGTRTARAAKRLKIKKLQNREAVVTLGENQIKNVFEFCGHLADGDPFHALL